MHSRSQMVWRATTNGTILQVAVYIQSKLLGHHTRWRRRGDKSRQSYCTGTGQVLNVCFRECRGLQHPARVQRGNATGEIRGIIREQQRSQVLVVVLRYVADVSGCFSGRGAPSLTTDRSIVIPRGE